MTRALTHIGLAVAIVLAPALCCCQAGWFADPAHAACIPAPAPPAARPPADSCCLASKKTCCDETPRHPAIPSEKPHAPDCACCAERPDAALPENALGESAPQPTGELLSLALAGLLVAFHEHAGPVRVSHWPDRAGVDARYAALFERHVLRC